MNPKVLMGIMVLVLVSTCGASAYADQCLAEAEFLHSYPANNDNTKFKFKFRISSEECTNYSCSGWVRFRIHFDWISGGSNSKSTLVKYFISKGQRSVEVTDETYPSGATLSLNVRDVEIFDVSCSTP